MDLTPGSESPHAADQATHHDATGPGDAPPIVLVHGSVVTRAIWLPQLRGLSDEFRVLAPDLPGHGTRARTPFSFAAAVDCVSDLIRRDTPGRALVAGLSLGGYVAIELSRRHPEQVAGLVLSGCSLNFTGVLGLYLKAVSALMRRGWMTQTRAQAEAKTRRMFPAHLADVADAQMRSGVYPEALGSAFAEMAGRDFAAALHGYAGPGLILNGERDRACHAGEGAFATALRPGAVERVPGAGHACNLDNAEAYNGAVRRFARSVVWGSGTTPSMLDAGT